MTFQQGFVDINGCKVSLRRGGAGEPLLFLHGASGAPAIMPFMEKLAMKAKAQIFGDVTIDQAIELGLFVCGSPASVKNAFGRYWNDMRFGNLLVMCQFGTLPADLTRNNMETFAREVMPALKKLN